LIENPTRRQELAGAGRRHYEERFTARPWVASTRALYDAVLLEMHSAPSSRHGPTVPHVLKSAAGALVASFLSVHHKAQSMPDGPADNDVSSGVDEDGPIGGNDDPVERSVSASRVA